MTEGVPEVSGLLYWHVTAPLRLLVNLTIFEIAAAQSLFRAAQETLSGPFENESAPGTGLWCQG
jgi:hypothetical protein